MIKLFVSDLHLEASRPDIYQIFLDFLAKNTKPDRVLYILGDFFESWVGDDDDSPFNQLIINALRTATSNGLPIYFIHGNRDFLLGKKFFRSTGVKLLADECVVDIHGKPTLIMHGDTLCLEDVKYIKFRKKTRRWWVQKLFLMKSLNKRKEIFNRYREASKQYVSTTPAHIMDVTQSEVERVMKKFGVQHLIHGHTHRQHVHHLNLNNSPASRTVLGAWHENGNALVCEGNEWKMISLES